MAETYKFFINYSDSILREEFKTDTSNSNYYKDIKKDSLVMTSKMWEDSLSLLNKQWYVGHILFPMQPPMYCELYKVNLQGSEEEEFVGVLSMAQPMGGSSYIFIFDTKQNGYRPLGQIELSSFRNPCEVTFKKLLSDSCFEIVAYSDLHLSIYATQGLRVLHLEKNILYESLEVATFFDDGDTIESKEVTFRDADHDLVFEAVVESKKGTEKSPDKILSRSTETYLWNPNTRKYESRQIKNK